MHAIKTKPKNSHTLIQELDEIAAKKRAETDGAAAETPAQMFLPGMEEWVRAMPNHLARSSLFAPVARGRKKMHNEAVLVSRSDCVLTYTGEQLDEAQADVALQLIFDAKHSPLGAPVSFHRRAFLKSIGRATSGPNYEWLQRTMKAFAKATLIIEAKKPDGAMRYHVGSTETFRILSFKYSEDTEEYSYTLDPRWKTLFGNREYALVDWEKRLQIGRNQDMAKTLQRLIATSKDSTQRYNLEWLKDKMQYMSPMRKFKESLLSSIEELKRLEVIASGQIEMSTKGAEQLTLIIVADELL